MDYTPPEFHDWDPRFPVSAEKLTELAKQKQAAVDEVTAQASNPATPIGLAIAQAAAEASVGFHENGDGTLTLSSGLYTNNGDGTITIGD